MPRAVLVSGVLPATLAENSRPGDWAATLSLSGDLDGLVGVELLGRDALDFSASLLPGLDAVRIVPGAMVDYESLASPVLSISLRLRFADGGTWDDLAPRSVTVLDVDDTAPTGLAFASGGTLVAGAIGSAIGRLAVTDPDTLSGFRFSFGPEDDWRFEVVDGVLKLRDGISLGLDDMPQRPLVVEVSDGRQSAGFLLWLGVADPNARPGRPAAGGDPRRLRPGGCRHGADAPRKPRPGAGGCAGVRGTAADPAGGHPDRAAGGAAGAIRRRLPGCPARAAPACGRRPWSRRLVARRRIPGRWPDLWRGPKQGSPGPTSRRGCRGRAGRMPMRSPRSTGMRSAATRAGWS
ncbi:hypothetical protein [Dankookia sp. P2]|uniref:hypothetical protein n=1 Tax=Dankookia sp. P2 TaxID=3423955 RepID=UPI003D6699AC